MDEKEKGSLGDDLVRRGTTVGQPVEGVEVSTTVGQPVVLSPPITERLPLLMPAAIAAYSFTADRTSASSFQSRSAAQSLLSGGR